MRVWQAGNLQKTMDNLAGSGAEHAKQAKALSALSVKGADAFLDEVADTSKSEEASNAKDITQELLSTTKRCGPSLPVSNTAVYKGILRKLCAQTNFQRALAVHDALLCHSVQDALLCAQVQDRWKQREYVPLGMVVFSEDTTPHEHTEELVQLASELMPLIFLSVRGQEPWHAWEVVYSSDWDGPRIWACSLQTHVGRRQVQEGFLVLPVASVGVTMEDEVSASVCQAMRNLVRGCIAQLSRRRSREGMLFMREVFTVPDGLCIYHCVLASCDIEAHESIARTDLGFAVNKRRVKLEADMAQQLRKMALQKTYAEDQSLYLQWRKNAGKFLSLDVEELHWLADVLQLSIRCIIEDEAPRHVLYVRTYVRSARRPTYTYVDACLRIRMCVHRRYVCTCV